jgi:D-glycero-alpha-D-manno-heptose-7-phosphate kinase
MLVVRAPMRISYAGGGTDLQAYYQEHGGVVVSVSINKYFYVVVNPNQSTSLQVSSADYRAFLRYDEAYEAMGVGGELTHAREAFRYMGIGAGYSVFMASEVPSGTGLGSSSAVAVALVKALSTLKGQNLTRAALAEAACEIEIKRLRMPIGKQDQYAAAFGGLNAVWFDPDSVRVEPLDLPIGVLRRLEASTMLFYTGEIHDSSTILRGQESRTREGSTATLQALHTIKAAAVEVRQLLLDGDLNALGEVMDRAWDAKKSLSPSITTDAIDRAYSAAREAGALGGKIAGAGGGGFLVLYVPLPNQDLVTRVLHGMGLVKSDFQFDHAGARVLMNNVGD